MARQAPAEIDRSTVEHSSNAPSRGFASLARPGLHILLVLLVGVAVLECASFVAQALAYPKLGYDFSVYFAAALALRDNPHANIYNLQVLQATANAHHAAVPTALYLYPPILAVCLIPLTLLPYGVALALWEAGCLACWLCGAALIGMQLARLLRPAVAGASTAGRRREGRTADVAFFAAAVAAFLALTYGPLMQAFSLGQVTLLIFAVAAAVPFLLGRQRGETAAGILLGFATLVKLFPAVLLLYFAVRGRHRLTIAALATMAAGTLALIPLVGLDGVLATRFVLTNGGANSMQFHNESLARVPLWIGVELGAPPSGALASAGYLLIALVFVAFLAGLVVSEKRLRRQSGVAQAAHLHGQRPGLAGYAWALSTMVLVTPILWEHYDAWLLPAIATCLGYAIHCLSAPSPALGPRRRRELWILGVALAAYALTTNALPFAYDGLATFSPGPYIAGHPIRPYFMLLRPFAALLLWIATGALYLREVVGQAEPTPSAARNAAPAPATATFDQTRRPATGLLGLVAFAVPAGVIGMDVAVSWVTSLAHP